MILVDSRVGSRELLQTIRNLGVEAETAPNLDADFQFDGNGPDGSVLIGIERKTIADLVDSITSERLAGGQIGRMLSTYSVCYIIVEGIYQRSKLDGSLEVLLGREWRPLRTRITYDAVDRFLCSLEETATFRLRRTRDDYETAVSIVNMYKFWDKEWHDHTTAKAIYAPVSTPPRTSHKPQIYAIKATPVEKWICQLPLIDGRAHELAKLFKSPYDLATADEARWLTIKGHRLGKKTIATILEWIHGK